MVTKGEQELREVERKLQVASSAVLLAQHSALSKAEETQKCRGKVEDGEERAGSNAREDAKMAKKGSSKFEADYFSEVGGGGMRLGSC